MSGFLNKIVDNFQEYSGYTAIVINGESWSYEEFSRRIAALQQIFLRTDKPAVAVLCHNHIDTYAAIFALWFSGKCFVPLNPAYPLARNRQILFQAQCKILFDPLFSDEFIEDADYLNFSDETEELPSVSIADHNEDLPLYTLFTSGSTGNPKGITVSRKNFQAFLDGSLASGFQFDRHDRFLQMYDLTFDGSFQCYVTPLLFGASFYTVEPGQVKYLAAIKTMLQNGITVSKMTPSVLFLLKPHFKSIHLPKLRYALFGGEALSADLVTQWSECAPNATMVNVYGPSETTVNVTSYFFNCLVEPESIKGTISIGRPHCGVDVAIIDSGLNLLNVPAEGELCVSGRQVFNGYLNEPELKEAFLTIGNKSYYRTGDRVYQDESGKLFFLGRRDLQVQINGYRVELNEIEALVQKWFSMNAVAAEKVEKNGQTTGLLLYIESSNGDKDEVLTRLKSSLPNYMVPNEIYFIQQFPRLVSGKTDRQKLKELR